MKKIILLFLMVVLVAPLSVIAKTTNDTLLGDLWYLDQIKAQDAWETTTGSKQVVVAVLDTGVDKDHPDLAGNIWINTDEIAGDGIDNDRNGFVDDVDGWDFVDNDNDSSPDVITGYDRAAVVHGTLVSGVIGAVGNNSEGVVGVNWDVRIMPLRILDEFGTGSDNDAVKAVNYAINQGVDVINLSLVGDVVDPGFQIAVKRAYDHGIVTVAAIGNEVEFGRGDTDIYPVFPACLRSLVDEDWVIGVAASDRFDNKASFSSFGRDCTDLAAPGVDMFGTIFQDSENSSFSEFYGGYWNGTSAAAPIVSGSVALLLSRFPSLTPAKIKTILQLSVDPLHTSGTTHVARVGAGRINIARAVEIAHLFAPPVILGETKTSIFFSAGPGEDPTVDIFDVDGEHEYGYEVYAHSFRGGVSTAVADVDSDGEPEFVTIPRSGGTAQVRWFELDGTRGGQFFAFPGQTGGWSVAVGDLEGDGTKEIIVSSRDPGVNQVQVYNISGVLLKEFDFAENRHGSIVRVGDVDGRLGDEIVLAPVSGVPIVTILKADGVQLNRFPVSSISITQGVNLALGDINDDGKKEIIVGTRDGSVPEVRRFNFQGSLLDIFAVGGNERHGIQVAVGDINRDGRDDLITTDSENASEVRLYDGLTLINSWDASFINEPGAEVSAWSF